MASTNSLGCIRDVVGASGGGRCRRTVQGALHGGHCQQGGGFAINLYVWGWAQKTLGREFALLVHPMQPSVLLVLRLPDQARLLQDHDLLHELAELWLADCALVATLLPHPATGE